MRRRTLTHQGPEAHAVRDLLGIPEDRLIRTVISLGRPDPATVPRSAPGTARKPLEEVVRDERYA